MTTIATTNPFLVLAAAGHESEMDRLARIVTCAHITSDVAAGCRVEAAMQRLDVGEYRNLSAYFDGYSFEGRWEGECYADMTSAELDSLRELAWAYIERNERTQVA